MDSDRTFGVYLTILSVLAGSIAISSLYLVLPFSVIDDILLHRPYEIPSLILFIIASDSVLQKPIVQED